MLVFSKYVYFDSFFPTKLWREEKIQDFSTHQRAFFFFNVAMENECSVSANMVENS